MGACASCLGRRGRDSYDDTRQSDESRLLYEDGNGMAYGSFGDAALGGDDSLEAQREAEALQRVVAKTSNNMVDVFEIAPHGMPTTRTGGHVAPFAYAGQGARVARYQHLVSKLNADGDGDAGGGGGGVRVDWLTDDDYDDDEAAAAHDSESGGATSIKTLPDDRGGATLVGTFADAAAAMQ